MYNNNRIIAPKQEAALEYQAQYLFSCFKDLISPTNFHFEAF
jgi:hypothetical protein